MSSDKATPDADDMAALLRLVAERWPGWGVGIMLYHPSDTGKFVWTDNTPHGQVMRTLQRMLEARGAMLKATTTCN